MSVNICIYGIAFFGPHCIELLSCGLLFLYMNVLVGFDTGLSATNVRHATAVIPHCLQPVDNDASPSVGLYGRAIQTPVSAIQSCRRLKTTASKQHEGRFVQTYRRDTVIDVYSV